MKYIMMIYQGDALGQQAELSEEEQKQVAADYQGINQTPGVTPGLPMGLPQNATTVRVEGGRTLTTDGPPESTRRSPSPSWTIWSHPEWRDSRRCAGSGSSSSP